MIETLPRRSDRPRPRRRRRGLIVLFVLILLLVGVAGGAGAYYQWAIGASGEQKPVSLVIERGATGQDVADQLKAAGVIRSPLAFRLFARFRGFSAGFEAGKYRMTTNMTVTDALAKLKAGPFVESTAVTFPEGYTVEQMAKRAASGLKSVKAEAFLKLARGGRYSAPPYLPAGTKSVEGFLFPSTYDFLKDATANDVIERMIEEFRRRASTLPWDQAKALGVTPYQVVIVASMIEREAKFPEDRAKVAAVVYNRLKKGMPLQIDATVLYAVTQQRGAPSECGDPPVPCVTLDDLKIDSPYNTYTNPGLPPGPIASPGYASLEAALSPAKADYLYYVVIDAAGHHAFTDSYQEFLRLKNGS